MKKSMKFSAFMLTGTLLFAACGNKEQKSATATNENPTEQKVAVKDVEGRKNFGDAAVITPLPAIMIATWDEKENPDVMMAAWGGQCGPKHITFQLSAHKTTENIRLKKAFTISFATKDDIVQSDYFGIVSGNDVPDKVAKAGFTITKSDLMAFVQTKFTIALRKYLAEKLYSQAAFTGNHGPFSALTPAGNIDLGKLQPVIFDSAKRTYRVVGEKVADAWGAGKTIIEKEVK